MVDAERNEVVVLREVPFRRELHADQETRPLLDRLHIRLDELEAVRALKASVQVDERDARLLLRRPARLHDIVDRLDVGLVRPDVVARRAEQALQRL